MKRLKFHTTAYQIGGSKFLLIPAVFAKGLDLTKDTPVTLEIVGERELKIKFG